MKPDTDKTNCELSAKGGNSDENKDTKNDGNDSNDNNNNSLNKVDTESTPKATKATKKKVKGKGKAKNKKKSEDTVNDDVKGKGEIQPLNNKNSNDDNTKNEYNKDTECEHKNDTDLKKKKKEDPQLSITEGYIATHIYDEVSDDDISDQEDDQESNEELVDLSTLSVNDSQIPKNANKKDEEINDEDDIHDEDSSFLNEDSSYAEYNYSHVDSSSPKQQPNTSTPLNLPSSQPSISDNLQSPLLLADPRPQSPSTSLSLPSSPLTPSQTSSRAASLRSTASIKMSPAAAKLRSSQVFASLNQPIKSSSSSQKRALSMGSSGFSSISGISSNISSGASNFGNNLSSAFKNNLGAVAAGGGGLGTTISGFGERYFGFGSKKNNSAKAGSSSNQNDASTIPKLDLPKSKRKSRASITFPFISSSSPDPSSEEQSGSGSVLDIERPSLRTVASTSQIETLGLSPTGKTPALLTSKSHTSSPTTAISFDTGFGGNISGFDDMMMASGSTPFMDYTNNDQLDFEDSFNFSSLNERSNDNSLQSSQMLNVPPQNDASILSPQPRLATTSTTDINSPSPGFVATTSPAPTMSIDPGSDVATLLSEVLDGDLDAPQNSNSRNGTQTGDDASILEPVEPISLSETHTDSGLNYPALSESSECDSDDAGDNSDDDYDFDIHSTIQRQHDQQDQDDQSYDSEDSDTRAARQEKELAQFLARKKQYFILSTAGKPIYSMYGSDELITGYMGVFQAIVSYFEDDESENEAPANTNNKDKDKNKGQLMSQKEGLRFLRAGNTMFVFALEDPLILIAVDKLGQTESQLRSQLDLLYAQILSTLTKSQLSKVFRGRTNFDLRPMLAGTEIFLNALTSEMSFGSPGILLGALECLRLRKSVRAKMHTVLSERRTKSLLYGMIVADSRLVAVIRPRRHSLHPPDLHLVFSMIFNTHSFSKGSGEHWVPICLPKFNATGFLYAYIHFVSPPNVVLVLISADKSAFFELQEAKERIVQDLETQNLISPIMNSLKRGRYRTIEILGTPHLSTNLAAAVAETSGGAITGVGRDRVSISAPKAASPQSQRQNNSQQLLQSNQSIPASLLLAPFTIRHFLYKSKQNVQFVMPSFDPHYVDPRARHRLMVLYHQLHSAVHATGSGSGVGSGTIGSGGAAGLRVYHVACGKRGVKGSALAWITPTFELYCVTGSAHESIPLDEDGEEEEEGGGSASRGTNKRIKAAANLVAANINNKDAMLRAVKAIVSWIKSHEERLFIFGGAVF